mmetsp:Transcript_14575/g.17733  ORF Transcript_14575/g.17733 Transcript_14575/m.17733 type:complete len:290 (+) Transcript_14575:131-1000(+)
MPTKKKGGGETSKKSDQKKKAKLLEDKTFGLKNKNKSKKVQAFVQATTKSINNSGDAKQRKADEDRKRRAVERKALKKAQLEERNALFGEALLAVKKKTSVKTKGTDEAKGRDHNDTKEKSGTSKAMKMMFQMDAKEMEEALTADPNYVRTLEDDVEVQRQKKLEEFKEKGIKGTPVTEESFKAWQDRKRKAKQEAAKKLVDAELKKKKGGKGLSVLSGRQLFDYKSELFKDNDDGQDDTKNDKKESSTVENTLVDEDGIIEKVADKVKSELFLDDDDDNLDLEDLDDE